MDSTRVGSAGMDSAGMGSAGMDSAGMGSAGVDNTRVGSAGMDSTRVGSARMDSTRMDSTGMDSARMNSAGMVHAGTERTGCVFSRMVLTRSLVLAVFAMLLFFAPSIEADAAWKTTTAGKMYTISDSPGYATGLVKIGSYKYYFNASGIMQTGFVTINEKLYYFNESGQMQYGWITVNKKKYYANKKTGVLYVSTWSSSGKYYFQSDGSLAVSTWVGNKWVDENGKYTGKTKTGFVTFEGNTYYYKSSTQYVTGWFKVSGKYYYADSDGIVQKSKWIGKRYVNSSGVRVTGMKKIGSKTYIFQSDGKIYSSRWVKYSGKYYYCNGSGVVQMSKWLTISGKKYYVNSSGVRVTGWKTISKKKYYFSSSGVMQTGKQEISSSFYYFGTDGVLVTSGWVNSKYYAGSTGAFLTGLQAIDGEIYYFSKTTAKKVTGKMKTVSGSTYYFSSSNGAAVRSQEVEVSGKYYYFGEDGKMVTSTYINQYYYGSDGARDDSKTLTAGWYTTSAGTFYRNSKGKNVTGWMYKTNTDTGVRDKYYLDPDNDGAMVTGIKTIGTKKYYFYSSGAMAKSVTIAVGTTEYTINAKGVITSESGITVSGSSQGAKIAAFAIQYVGNPYVYGGTSLTNGADCSGFTYTVFANFSIKLLRTAQEQMVGPSSTQIKAGYAEGTEVEISLDSLQPGDLLFYGSGSYASHVAIYIGDGKIVHASNSQAYPAGGIKISDYDYNTPIKAVRYWS
ncbi:MAG: NlpC/P60 family protein [Lachnospiraceae bacterium]|nr:NlpC/P60 family protein [Lachnospiraceae bacterium]